VRQPLAAIEASNRVVVVVVAVAPLSRLNGRFAPSLFLPRVTPSILPSAIFDTRTLYTETMKISAACVLAFAASASAFAPAQQSANVSAIVDR